MNNGKFLVFFYTHLKVKVLPVVEDVKVSLHLNSIHPQWSRTAQTKSKLRLHGGVGDWVCIENENFWNIWQMKKWLETPVYLAALLIAAAF